MNSASSQHVILACVLAAGLSSRFGTTKLVAELNGRPLLRHVLDAAEIACHGNVRLVVGHDQDRVVKAAAVRDECVIVNDDYKSGIGSSIAAGIKACRSGADAVIVVLGDQPLVTAQHLGNLIEQWTGARNEIIATSCDGTNCPPILFASGAFDDLAALTGDTGAKQLLASDQFVVKTVEFSPAIVDVDTQEDLGQLKAD